jgi:hypothetical protein
MVYIHWSVDSFEFEEIGSLATNKFQLFNEYGFNFYSSKYLSQQITSVVAVNNDSKFYSKWVYGEEFEIKFPIGSLISFDNYLFEFTSPEKAFVVVASKKGAVMIITTVDNSTFENMYSNIDSTTYMNKFISGLERNWCL